MPVSAPSGSQEILTLDHVSAVLSGRPVLEDVTFSVRAGELTGLIGSNGAGKTTLLRVILGLERPSSGAVRMHSGSLRSGSAAYLPQRIVLDPDLPLRARDLVELGVDGHRFGMWKHRKQRRERAAELIAAVGAEAFADSRVGRLSGGEQQRVLIAHALASQPSLLLLDEPLANLDLRSGHEVVSLLHRLVTERALAVLLSAHDMNPLLRVMDRVVYLAAGKAIAGTTEEVVRSDVLSDLYGHPVDVLRLHGRVVVISGEGSEDLEPHVSTVLR